MKRTIGFFAVSALGMLAATVFFVGLAAHPAYALPVCTPECPPGSICLPGTDSTGGICVPVPTPVPVLDHFKCYNVEAEPKFFDVILIDQFDIRDGVREQVRLKGPVALCNPTRKIRPDIGEETRVTNPGGHLVCYQIQQSKPAFRPRRVIVKNQFTRPQEQELKVLRPERLCVPSDKCELPLREKEVCPILDPTK